MHMKVFSISEVHAIAEDIVRVVTERALHGVTVSGNVGAGKTTLAQAIGSVLGVKPQIISPTFILMKRYDATTEPFSKFVHIDAYRVESEQEARTFMPKRAEGDFFYIEWPERLGAHLPPLLLSLELSYVSEDKRGIMGL